MSALPGNPGTQGRSARHSPRYPNRQKQQRPALTFQHITGTFVVSSDNQFYNNIGQEVLGRGAAAVVVLDKTNPDIVYKIVRDPKAIQQESYMHSYCACIGIAPNVLGLHQNVLQMQRIETFKTFPDESEQSKIVSLIARMVAIGLIHNDLHMGHIGKIPGDETRLVLIDFGHTEKIDTENLSNALFLQVVLAQLYALIDPSNPNNITRDMLTSSKKVFVDCIYAIRTHKMDTNEIRTILSVRALAIQMFNMHCKNLQINYQ